MRIRNLYLILVAVTISFYGCTDDTVEPVAPPVAEYTQVDFEPAWNINGDEIVYAHSNIDNDLSGIYIISTGGLINRQVISNFARSPDWSADGNKILYSQFLQIFKADVSGDSIIQLTSSGENYYPKWSPDESLITFSRYENQNYKVMVMNADGTGLYTIDNNANYPEWENNSASLMYFKPVTGSDGVQTGDTLYKYVLSSNTKTLITILSGDVHKVNMYPVYADDEIIFCSMDKDGYCYIYKMQRNGSNIVKLTFTQGYSPDYSSAIQKIVYTNRDKGNGRLWIMDKDGSNKIQLTH